MKKVLASTLATTLSVSSFVAPSLFTSHQAHAMETSGLVDKAIQSGLDFDLALLKVDLFGDSKVSAGYRYDIEPSFHRGLITRYDKFYLDTDLNGTETVKSAGSADFSVGMGLRHEIEFQFARQFKDAKSAAVAKPYFRENIPWDAKRALMGLKIGDYFSIKSPMNLVVKGSLLKALNSSLALQAEAYYLLAGEFQLHTVRLNDNKIRIKVMGLKKKEKGGSLSLGYDYSGAVDIFKVDYINKKVTNLLDLTPVRYSFNDGKNDVLMVDYILDLSDREVSEAFDQMMKKAADVRELAKVLNPTQSSQDLRKRLLVDVEPVDAIFRKDQGTTTRIARKFKGTLDQEYNENKLKLDLKLIKGQMSETCSENKIVSVGSQEDKSHYRLDSCVTSMENGFLFSWMKLKNETRMNTVFKTDENFENRIPDDLVISIEKKDNRFQPKDVQAVKEQLSSIVPPSIASLVDFNKWTQTKKSNVLVRYQVVMHPNGIFSIPAMSKSEIAQRYMKHLKDNYNLGDLLKEIGMSVSQEASDFGAEENRIKTEVEGVASILSITANPKFSKADRLATLMKMKKNALFLRTGIRFMIELMPQNQLETLVHFEFLMESTKGDRLQTRFGNRAEGGIYDRLLLIQNLINNNGVDARLEAETLYFQQMMLMRN